MKKVAAVLLPVFLLLSLSPGCATHNHDLAWQSDDPFYQQERESETYGVRSPLEKALQLDPGDVDIECSPTFMEDPPRRIAILPFENLEGGNFRLNWVPVTGRDGNEEDNWSWTYANRLRKLFFAYMSLREFDLLSLLETDTILKELGITNAERLYNADPRDLATALGVDALIYGKMTDYNAKYLFLYTQVAVGLTVKCVSGKDGSELFVLSEVRRNNKFRVALSPIDLIAASVQNTFNVRKHNLARAAEEVCREIVSKIPIAKSLVEEKELYWKEFVASSKRIQAVKDKMAIADGSAVLLAEDADADVPAAIRIDESSEMPEGITEGIQLANANGVVRATESPPVLISQLNNDEGIRELIHEKSFAYVASTPGVIMDETLGTGIEEKLEITRADIVYRGGDALTEIDTSDIVYSNGGVVADSPADTDNQEDAGLEQFEEVIDEIIEMSISDIIYSNKGALTDSPPETASS